MAQANKKSVYQCGRRTKTCKGCGYRFKRKGTSDYDLWNCPKCGVDRHCAKNVKIEGRACKLHGGKSLKGINSPRYEGKGYSKYMPQGLREKQINLQDDPELVSLENEILLSRALVADQVESLNGRAVTELWGDAHKLYNSAIQAQEKGNKKAMGNSLVSLGTMLGKGLDTSDSHEKALDQVNKSLETTRRLLDTQRQIYKDRGDFVAKGAVIMVMDAFTTKVFELLESNITNAEERTNILSGLLEVWSDVFGGVPQTQNVKQIS